MFITITWDDNKARANVVEHGISFTEAATVFNDPLKYTEDADEHSHGEERFTTVGYSAGNRIVRITHLEDYVVEYDVMILHIISARKPAKREREAYENG